MNNLLQSRIDGFSQNKYIAILSILGSMFIAFFLAVKTVRAIGLPIQEIGGAVEAIIGGNLTVKLKVDGRDELGILAKNFSTMIQTLISENAKEAVKMARTTAMVENSPSNLMMIDNDLNLIY